MTPILVNMIYGATTIKTFPIQINNNRRMTKRTINLRRLRVVHHPVPVAVGHGRNLDRNHFHVLVPSQIHNINPVRLVVSTVNRNHLAMVEAVVDVQVLGQDIVDRIVRPKHGLEADPHNEVVEIMMAVVVRRLFTKFIHFTLTLLYTRIGTNTHSILVL